MPLFLLGSTFLCHISNAYLVFAADKARPRLACGDRMTKGRMEAFSDGVIAIIITIMVLEMKVPNVTA